MGPVAKWVGVVQSSDARAKSDPIALLVQDGAFEKCPGLGKVGRGLIGMKSYLKRLGRKCRIYRHSKCDTERADQRQGFHNARILGPISRTCNGPLYAILRGCRRAVRSEAR